MFCNMCTTTLRHAQQFSLDLCVCLHFDLRPPVLMMKVCVRSSRLWVYCCPGAVIKVVRPCGIEIANVALVDLFLSLSRWWGDGTESESSVRSQISGQVAWSAWRDARARMLARAKVQSSLRYMHTMHTSLCIVCIVYTLVGVGNIHTTLL